LKKVLSYISAVTIILLLLSCGGGGGGAVFDFEKNFKEVCTLEGKKSFLYQLLNDIYLWSEEVPKDANLSKYSNEYELLDALIYKERDHYSFVIDKKRFDDIFIKDSMTGFGLLTILDEQNSTFKVIAVYRDSPAFKAGIKRSDSIEVISSFKDDKGTITNEFRVHRGGDEFDINITEESFKKDYIFKSEVFEIEGKKVGYFVLSTFIGDGITKQIDREFERFKRDGVEELIVDLRYNGGGYISASAHLGALIAGDRVMDKIFLKQKFNKKYSHLNRDLKFPHIGRLSLNLDRVFIITTKYTASASEVLIDSLRPYIDVITIGERTYGKQYAMHIIDYCDMVVNLVDMVNFNANESGRYMGVGIEPVCKAKDDLRYDFGDIDESSLSESIYYIRNGSCKE
jgi:C-terminal processing protease CtpA/Prc